MLLLYQLSKKKLITVQCKCECINMRNLSSKFKNYCPLQQRRLNLNGLNTRNIKLINQPDKQDVFKMFAPILSTYVSMFIELKIPIHLHKAPIWIVTEMLNDKMSGLEKTFTKSERLSYKNAWYKNPT